MKSVEGRQQDVQHVPARKGYSWGSTIEIKCTIISPLRNPVRIIKALQIKRVRET